MTQGARIIVLEDHPLVRSALVHTVVLHVQDATVVYEGPSIVEALAAAGAHGADCALLDLDLGDNSRATDNISALVALGIPVMVLSAMTNSQRVREAIRAGALAYVSKQSPEETIVGALQSTLRLEPFMSVDLALALAGEVDPDVDLSPQERTALTLYASGMKMDSVARRMDVSRTSAQELIKRVREKYATAGLEVSTKTDLYRVAHEQGLID